MDHPTTSTDPHIDLLCAASSNAYQPAFSPFPSSITEYVGLSRQVFIRRTFSNAAPPAEKENMLYDSQRVAIRYFKEALSDRSWREAYHLLAHMGFPHITPDSVGDVLLTDNEIAFASKHDEILEALTYAVHSVDGAKKNLLSWSAKEARGDTAGGLGAATCSPQLQQAISAFLKHC